MNLVGWGYVGRVLNEKSHNTMVNIAIQFRDSVPQYNKVWGKDLQTLIGGAIGIKSTGQVRTFKRFMEQFGIIRNDVLNSKEVPQYNEVITDDGKVIVNLSEIRSSLLAKGEMESSKLIRLIDEAIKLLYLKNSLSAKIESKERQTFRPAFLLVKACQEFESLDKNEWYLLNNFVNSERDEEEWGRFVDSVKCYRNNQIEANDIKIISNELSHSYLLNSFENLGLVSSFEGSEMIKRYKLNEEHDDIIRALI